MNSDLVSKDLQHIWHPFTRQPADPVPLLITRGAGSLLYDEAGKSYIDAISSWWVTLHGHSHPYIAEKLYQQALTLEQVIFAGFTHEPAIRLASRLLPLLPGSFTRVFYSDNGSTSTEVALKMAIQYWWNREQSASGQPARRKIMAFRNAYHGDTFGAMSVSDRGVFTLAFHDLLFDVIFLDTPTPENIGYIKSIVHQHGPETACFIYEPLVQGAGGMVMYDAYLLNELLNTMKGHDIICIADEVMTGFGRTGKLFASDHLHKKPDIICLSKGLTGGTMALGVTACTDRIYQAYLHADRQLTFFHGHSFTANPLACTAALASLDLLEQDDCLQRIEWICNQQAECCNRLKNTPAPVAEKIRNTRVLGTIVAMEINQGKDGYLNEVSKTVTRMAMDKGVYLRPLGNTLYLMPPYCTTPKEMHRTHEVVHDILEAI
jgi:adenosylmethionine-8-amino-7-oxononanoate aminotransferase